MMSSYSFGEYGTVQYNITTQSPVQYSSKTNSLSFIYNEIGSIDGKDRICNGTIPESSTPCPADAPNNGKQMYGTRKIEFNMLLPVGKTYHLKININYSDLKSLTALKSELSWLQEKKLMILITDENKKQVLKEFINATNITIDKKDFFAGNYLVSIFPTYDDGSRLTPSLELNHLNHGERSR
jgi:hypothetical protein